MKPGSFIKKNAVACCMWRYRALFAHKLILLALAVFYPGAFIAFGLPFYMFALVVSAFCKCRPFNLVQYFFRVFVFQQAYNTFSVLFKVAHVYLLPRAAFIKVARHYHCLFCYFYNTGTAAIGLAYSCTGGIRIVSIIRIIAGKQYQCMARATTDCFLMCLFLFVFSCHIEYAI